jgi:hypothetical protein
MSFFGLVEQMLLMLFIFLHDGDDLLILMELLQLLLLVVYIDLLHSQLAFSISCVAVERGPRVVHFELLLHSFFVIFLLFLVDLLSKNVIIVVFSLFFIFRAILTDILLLFTVGAHFNFNIFRPDAGLLRGRLVFRLLQTLFGPVGSYRIEVTAHFAA